MAERPDLFLMRAQYDISLTRTNVERDVLSLIAWIDHLERALAASERDRDRARERLIYCAIADHTPSQHGGAPSFETCEIQWCWENAAALATIAAGGGEADAK